MIVAVCTVCSFTILKKGRGGERLDLTRQPNVLSVCVPVLSGSLWPSQTSGIEIHSCYYLAQHSALLGQGKEWCHEVSIYLPSYH